MVRTTDTGQVEQVYELLKTYGPATAIDFMQQASGGLHGFPPSLLMQVNIALRAQQLSRRQARQGSSRESIDE